MSAGAYGPYLFVPFTALPLPVHALFEPAINVSGQRDWPERCMEPPPPDSSSPSHFGARALFACIGLSSIRSWPVGYLPTWVRQVESGFVDSGNKVWLSRAACVESTGWVEDLDFGVA
ncbi:unnamed protein product [Calypogeia fissa]